MVMKCLIAATGVGMVVVCAAFAAAAKPSDSIERSLRMVTDAVRDDVRTVAVGEASGKNASPQRSRGNAFMCGRRGGASEIFGCARSNRNPIDR